MEKDNNQNKPGRERKEGYIIVPHYFLKEWVRILGVGPVVLYQELLTYCHKGKYIAWPTIDSLCQQMGIAKTTLLRYQNTLIKFGLIKNITRGKSTTGHYRNNIYQIISLKELSKISDPGKIIDFIGSKMKPDRYQNDTSIGSNMKLSLVSNRYPNNTNPNITKSTTTNGGKDAVVVVNFKKLKEKGEEKMQVLREQLRDLDIEGKFIEQLLKDYPTKKIEEKIDLLMERRNIKSPAGWLRSALKNDYRDEEQAEPAEQAICSTSHPHLNPPPSRGRKLIDNPHPQREKKFIDNPAPPQEEEKFKETLETDSQRNAPERVSREKDLKAIKLIQDNLSASISPFSSGKRVRARENVGVRFIEPVKLRGG